MQLQSSKGMLVNKESTSKLPTKKSGFVGRNVKTRQN